MFKKLKTLYLSFLFIIIFLNSAFSDVINSYIINGNKRISDDTILMFSQIEKNQKITDKKLNSILKDLYQTNFFENITVEFNNNVLIINVTELPIIQNITYEGLKTKKLKDQVLKNLNLKSKSSYNKVLLKNDKEKIQSSLKNLGYYFSKIDVIVEDLDDNKVNIKYDINPGNKSKIKKIKFIGNKIFKDSKLKSLIVSEEYKFWKFISGKKFLNENIINLDQNLLRNFYLNKGFYNVEIKTSYAKFINDDEF